MKSDERRRSMINLLTASDRPISGGKLAEYYGVSRQIIVKDIAILKARRYEICATHTGYIMQPYPYKERVFKVYHTTEKTEDELNVIVELGGTVVDVFVWHKAYGKMEAKLNISSKEQIGQFIKNVRTGSSVELMHVTGGYHYHTVRADTEDILDRIESALNDRKYIATGI